MAGPRPHVGCEPAILVRAETSGTVFTCEALWSDGTRVKRDTVPPVKLDRTRPTLVRVVRGRPPDSYGWYGSPVRITFTGRDARSGIARCTRRTYRGPNTWRARVTGTCIDRAGNRAVPRHRRLSVQVSAPHPARRHASSSALVARLGHCYQSPVLQRPGVALRSADLEQVAAFQSAPDTQLDEHARPLHVVCLAALLRSIRADGRPQLLHQGIKRSRPRAAGRSASPARYGRMIGDAPSSAAGGPGVED